MSNIGCQRVTASFSDAETLQQQFHMTAAVFAAVVLALAIGGALDSFRKPPTLNLSSVCAISLVALSCVVSFSYWSTYSEFVQADVSRSEVRLLHIGRFGKEVVVPRADIETILFGSPGKSNYSCYVRIRLRSGASYRSATLNKHLEICKSLRAQMLSALSA